MSENFHKGDKVRFQHWSLDATVIGTVLDSYRVMGETYLVVKTDSGDSYSPSEDRCSLEKA
jgi:hypothetical protein